MTRPVRGWVLLLCGVIAAGCSGPLVRQATTPWPDPGHCWLLLHLELQVWHGVGTLVVPDPGRSIQAESAARRWLDHRLGDRWRAVEPDPSLEQHLALYDRLAEVALRRSASRPLDLGIGPGLSSLDPACRHGLIIQGADVAGDAAPTALLSLGLVDLGTGALLRISAQPVEPGALDDSDVLYGLMDGLAAGTLP